MESVLDFTMCFDRGEDELRWKMRWQKEKNKKQRKRDVGWAEWASSHTAHLKASATVAATPGSRRQVGSPPAKSHVPSPWQLGEMTSRADTLPRLRFVLAGGAPPAIAGRRSEGKAKRRGVLWSQGSERCFKPLCGRVIPPGVRHGGFLRKQKKELMCDLMKELITESMAKADS